MGIHHVPITFVYAESQSRQCGEPPPSPSQENNIATDHLSRIIVSLHQLQSQDEDIIQYHRLLSQISGLDTTTATQKDGSVQKLYMPNDQGNTASHTPVITSLITRHIISTSRIKFEVEVRAPHVMMNEHSILLMWIKDGTGDVKAVKALTPEDAPLLRAEMDVQVTKGKDIQLIPYLICDLHGLWVGSTMVVDLELYQLAKE